MKIILIMTSFLFLLAHAQEVRPVGTFGGYITKEGKTEIPKSNGFLSFAADNNLEDHQLLWKRFDVDGKDYPIATMGFPVTNETNSLVFKDWSTLEVQTPSVNAYLSKTFPAVRYKSNFKSFTLKSPTKHMSVVINGNITHIDLSEPKLIDLSYMSEPWILLWTGQDATKNFDVPLYLTFEKRPNSLLIDAQTLKFNFLTVTGIVNLMPLRGVKRFNQQETINWHEGLPQKIIFEVRDWVQKLAAFPIGMKESYSIDSVNKQVNIVDTYEYEMARDDWGTVPTPIAPLPPVVLRAGVKRYPVTYPNGAPVMSEYATFYGDFGYQMGERSSYTIPLANALTRLPIALKVTNSEETTPIRQELERILTNGLPESPADYYVQNDDQASAFMCDAFSTLEKNGELRQKVYDRVLKLFSGSFEGERVLGSREPVTNQQYWSAGKHQYEFTSFDREWYTGRKLSTMARCAENLAPELAKKYWVKIQGLYRYSQIFFDWVTGSVTSSVFGFNQLADGIQFNWEGVLGVARMAKLVGDEETYQDAAYRSSRQQLALFAIWHQAEWSKAIDYGIAHFSVKRLPNDKIETRGAVDAWVEDFGSATLEFESNWQTANFLYFDNGAQYSLYRDFGIIEKVRKIEFEIMPEMHPNWKDGNAKDAIDNKYYGSGETVAHLLARAILFHNDPSELYKIYRGYEGTEVSRQWYTPYFYGNAGPLLLGIERAKAPVVEAPINGVMINYAQYNDESHEVAINYTCRLSGQFDFRITSIQGNVRTSSVSCEEGQQAQANFR